MQCQLHSLPSIQPVGCLNHLFPLCYLSRRTFRMNPFQWASYFIPIFFLMVPRFSALNLSIFECSHNLPRWPDPAAHTREPAKPETLLAEVASERALRLRPPAPSESVLPVVTITLIWDQRFSQGHPSCRPNLSTLSPPRLPLFPANYGNVFHPWHTDILYSSAGPTAQAPHLPYVAESVT